MCILNKILPFLSMKIFSRDPFYKNLELKLNKGKSVHRQTDRNTTWYPALVN
jgi:hypothetical protein